MESLGRGKSDWVRGSCVGRGCYGTVNMAVNKSDGRIFAVKSVDLRSCLKVQSEALENEIKILPSISSPYVVEYLSDDVTVEDGEAAFRNLHMEYMPGGTAADVVKDEGILRSRVYCIVVGLRDVHSAGIVHCDIKGGNVLVGSSPGAVKLADFGSASYAARSTVGQLTPRGSPLWMAPEVVRGEHQGPESDVWSLGCTLIEMVTGRPPWEDSGPDMFFRIGYSEELPELPAQLSELGKDFLDKCLRRDRAERWSCNQLLGHPFVSSCEPSTLTTRSSPRCVLDWTNLEFSENEEDNDQFSLDSELVTGSVRVRIGELASNAGAIWESDGWVEVRNAISDIVVGTSLEYSDSSGVEMDTHYSNPMNRGWVNMEVTSSCDGADVAAAEGGRDSHATDNDFSWMREHNGFTAGENIVFVNLLNLTATICTSIRLTFLKTLQLLFRSYLRFQSSHVTTLPRLLTLCAVFENFGIL